jgi:hypothetical protein
LNREKQTKTLNSNSQAFLRAIITKECRQCVTRRRNIFWQKKKRERPEKSRLRAQAVLFLLRGFFGSAQAFFAALATATQLFLTFTGHDFLLRREG